jgi:hypothetical protein
LLEGVAGFERRLGTRQSGFALTVVGLAGSLLKRRKTIAGQYELES